MESSAVLKTLQGTARERTNIENAPQHPFGFFIQIEAQ